MKRYLHVEECSFSILSLQIYIIEEEAHMITRRIIICVLVILASGGQIWCSIKHGLSGSNLTIVAIPWKPFLLWKCPNDEDWTEDWVSDCPNGDDRMYSGILWELLMFMQRARNFSFTFIGNIPSEEYLWGGTCYDANNCTGMIGRVNRHEADFALGKSLITN